MANDADWINTLCNISALKLQNKQFHYNHNVLVID